MPHPPIGRQASTRGPERAREHLAKGEDGRRTVSYHLFQQFVLKISQNELEECEPQSCSLLLKHRSEWSGGWRARRFSARSQFRILKTSPCFCGTQAARAPKVVSGILGPGRGRPCPSPARFDAMVDYPAHNPVMKTEHHNPNFHHSWHGVRGS